MNKQIKQIIAIVVGIVTLVVAVNLVIGSPKADSDSTQVSSEPEPENNINTTKIEAAFRERFTYAAVTGGAEDMRPEYVLVSMYEGEEDFTMSVVTANGGTLRYEGTLVGDHYSATATSMTPPGEVDKTAIDNDLPPLEGDIDLDAPAPESENEDIYNPTGTQ